MQRTQGAGRITTKAGHDGKSRIDQLYQQGAARIRVPDRLGRDDLEAVIINTAGGVTGGDRLSWEASAGAGTHLTVTTQACEKVYKADSGTAHVTVRLRAEKGATLAWLPQETILFDRAHLRRTIEAELEPDATLLLVEPVIFGRKAMGETVRTGLWHDTWRIHHKGALIHAENVRLGGQIAEHLDRTAGLAGRTALATLALFGNHAEAKLEGARDLLRADAQATGGASVWEQGDVPKLIIRIAAPDGYALRRVLISLINHLAAKPLGAARAAVPTIWSL
ncbi:MAG: urease accessory protein UreD [Devosiaceae bacterium]|nr:urease accessory protein UreD [Devosiaceae bacterium MH13]